MRVLVGLVFLLCVFPLFVGADVVTIEHKQPSLAEIAKQSQQKRTGKCRVYTEADLSHAPSLFVANPMPSVAAREGSRSIARSNVTPTDYNRLKALCRSAGADSSYAKPVRTDIYVVNGKTVKVTGPHANPKEIEHARRICQEAMAAEKALSVHRRDAENAESR